jgi:hypothetical protein
VLTSVRLFGPFNGDNDPHGEHDFVSVKVDGETYFGKIDYYAPDMEHGSEDLADEAKTVRVHTIMHSANTDVPRINRAYVRRWRTSSCSSIAPFPT